MRNMDSRYTLVVATAKRARQLTDGAEPLTKFRSDKPVTLAVHEIAEGKVEYYRNSAGLAAYGGDIDRLSAPERGYQLYGGITGEFVEDEPHAADGDYGDAPDAYGAYADHDGIALADDIADDEFGAQDEEPDEQEDAGWAE